MKITVLNTVTEQQEITFMVNGGYQTGRIAKIDGDEVVISYVQSNLTKNGEWISSKRTAKRSLSNKEVLLIR